jgi:hypothetical protein
MSMANPNYQSIGPQIAADGAIIGTRAGRLGDTIVSELNGRYYEQAARGRLFLATAIVTAPVIFSTAAGTGGPLIWNPANSGVNVSVLAITCGLTVVTTVAAALGLTGNTGQTSAPTATTAIDSRQACLIGGQASVSTPYRVGTPTNAGGFFFPLLDLHTGALTVDNLGMGWIDVGGAIVCPPGAWVSVAASATATTTVAQLGALYAEIPV